MASDSEGEFLKRWSRRKAEERKSGESATGQQDQKPDSETDESPAETQDETDLEATATGEQATEVENAELNESDFDDVDFEMLDFSSDFTRFMKKGVPESIQRRALRKLWGSDPILANIDGLNDYDEDYTNKGMAIKTLKTAYKVGSGYLTEEDYNTDAPPDADGEASAEDVAATDESVAQDTDGETGAEDITATDGSAEQDQEQSAAGTDGKDNPIEPHKTNIASQTDPPDEQQGGPADVEEKHKG